MQMTRELPIRFVTVLAQDPSIRDNQGVPLLAQVAIPNDRVLPGPKTSRFYVVDYDASLGRMIGPSASPAEDLVEEGRWTEALLLDPHFHAQNVHAIASATLLEFESALGRHISWGFHSGSHELKIAPHAFCMLNAFYSRDDEGLFFGYYPTTPGSDSYVFTCLCFDIVVHETTHAILDGLRSEYLRPASADQAAFHEAFADIVALLSVFRNDAVVSHGLHEDQDQVIAMRHLTPPALRKSFLFGLAREMSQAVGSGSPAAMGRDALRRSVEIEPNPQAYTSAYDADRPHDYGEVLVAVILNAFISIWYKRVIPLDPMKTGFVDRARAVEEGAKAARHLLTMSIRALDYLPSNNVTFGDYARALITADFETAPDDGRYGYRDVLRKSFADYGIVDAETPEALRWTPPPDQENLVYGFDGHAEMQWDRESLYRFLWENMATLGLSEKAYTKIVSVRPVVRHGPNGCVVRETVVEYTQQINTLASGLSGLGLTMPTGMKPNAYIELLGGGTLIFDDYGGLKYNIGVNVLGSSQQQRVQALWDAGHFERGRQRGARFAEVHLDRANGRPSVLNGESW